MSSQIFYSSIRAELKVATVKRGVLLGLLGVGIFLLMGVYLTPDLLDIWGLPGFILSGMLITLGLKPYRRLTALESRPHQLTIDSLGRMEFFYAGKPFLALCSKNIRQLRYRDVSDSYGIVVEVQNLDAIQARNPGLDLKAYAVSTRRRYGGDLFFPLFSKRSLEALNSHCNPI